MRISKIGTETFINIGIWTIYINWQYGDYYFQLYKQRDDIDLVITNEYFRTLQEIDDRKKKKQPTNEVLNES